MARLDAEATLTGNPTRPDGTLRLTARGLRLATGPTRALPAADLTATATLRGGVARLDLRAQAGTTQVTLTGTCRSSPPVRSTCARPVRWTWR